MVPVAKGTKDGVISAGRVFACVLAAACLCLGVPAMAQAEEHGVIGNFGNPSPVPGFAGGEFAVPAGVAVNDASGDIYVVDTGPAAATSNHRIERFDSSGNFISAWGADVISGAATGTGTLNETTTVTSVVATSGAFLVGQLVTGPVGIAPGTRIAAVSLTGPAATITLTKAATASGAGVALSVAAAPNNIPVNERQTVTLGANTTGGTFTLTAGATQGFAEKTTEPIPFNASASEVDAKLEEVGQIGIGNVIVSSPNLGGGILPGGPYTIECVGARADTNIRQVISGATNLTVSSGTKTATVATTTQGGAAYEICVVPIECKAGIGVVTGTGAAEFSLLAPGGSLNVPQGVAINQSSGHVYVTNQGLLRVEEFEADGDFVRAWGRDVVAAGKAGDKPPASAVQTLTVTATAGKYTLEFQGQKTGELAFDASAAEIQTALTGLSRIGSGNVEVTGASSPFTITFKAALANNPEPDIVAASSLIEPLSGGSASVATATPGSTGFEICSNAADCQKPGAATNTAGAFATTIGYPAVVPAGAAPNAGNVLVAELGSKRVSEFTSAGVFVRIFGGDVASAGQGNTGTGFEICAAATFDVCKVGIEGTAAGLFANGQPTRVAADTAGAIYTVESTHSSTNPRRVQKFTPQPGPPALLPASFAIPTLSSTENATAPTDVAVDSSNDHVYVVKGFPGEKRILELDSAGNLVETHIAGSGITAANGLATKTGGERQYLTSPTPIARALIIGPPLPPSVAIQASTAVGTNCATLHGTVNPNGGGSLHTFYRFEYSGNGGSSWTKATPTDTDIGSGEVAIPVEDTVCDLEPNKDYAVRLVAIKGGSPTISTGNLGDFKTDAAAPSVETYAAFWDSSTSELVLRGAVNPNNTATSYYFEYGIDACGANPCDSIPAGKDGDAGEGGVRQTVSERLAGLQPATTYHYRIVADNGVEVSPGITESKGAELTLTTPSNEPCVNEQFRGGASARLAECRAYEWVSNGDSWGVGINSLGLSLGDGGGRAQFKAQAFGQPKSTPGPYTPFTAVRGAAGWDVKEMLPDPARAAASPTDTNLMVAADLGTTLWLESSVLQSQRLEMQWSLNHLDGSSVVAPPLVSINHVGVNDDRALKFLMRGGAADLSTFTFSLSHETTTAGFQFVPDEPLMTGPFRSNLYAISGTTGPNPTFSVVNRAEGKAGAVLGGICGAGLGAQIRAGEDGTSSANAVSHDGSIIYFSARPGAPASGDCGNSPELEVSIGGPKRLFKRIDNEHTVAVSEAQCSPACTGPGGDDSYKGASTDGSVVYFTTPRRLLNTDTDNSEDLYVYDATPPGVGQPTLAQASAGEAVPGHPTPGVGAEVLKVLDTAADGSRVYFTAKGLLSGANARGVSPVAGEPNLYVYERDTAHPTGRIAFVATLAAGEAGLVSYALPRIGGAGDGSMLLLATPTKLLAEDEDSRRDLYRYDDDSGGLLCLTCMGSGPFDVSISLRGDSSVPSPSNYEQQGRPASADVSAVTFSTSESLLTDADLDGAADIYLWRDGVLSLVSGATGQLGGGSGISPDGNNVFFYTRAALVGADVNNVLDLYDARVGGGFPEAPPSPDCADSDGCQGRPTSPPTEGTAGGSDTFEGAGNPAAPVKCGKGKIRKKGRCVRKPTRHKQKAQQRRASHDRGGKR
jgi:hypothetical protein